MANIGDSQLLSTHVQEQWNPLVYVPNIWSATGTGTLQNTLKHATECDRTDYD